MWKSFVSLLIFIILGGCSVASFYPFYTRSDLHPETLLAGNWLDEYSTLWNFSYITVEEKGNSSFSDSTGYFLYFRKTEKSRENHHLRSGLYCLTGNTSLTFLC